MRFVPLVDDEVTRRVASKEWEEDVALLLSATADLEDTRDSTGDDTDSDSYNDPEAWPLSPWEERALLDDAIKEYERQQEVATTAAQTVEVDEGQSGQLRALTE